MAESLDIVDNPVNLASFELGGDVFEPVIYGVRIGVVGVLLRQSASRIGHSELALNFIEYHPGLVVLQVVIKILPVNRRHPDVGQPQPVLGIGLAPVALSQQSF